MKNADIHICRRWANDTWEFIDAYALDVGPPTRDQTLSGGSNNLFDTSAEYEGGVVTCRFSKCAASPLGRGQMCRMCCGGARVLTSEWVRDDGAYTHTGGSRQRIRGTRPSRKASTR